VEDSRDTLVATGEAQRSSCCVSGEEGMREAQHGNRSSGHLDAGCTASLRTAWSEDRTGCSSFSYKNRYQSRNLDLTQRS